MRTIAHDMRNEKHTRNVVAPVACIHFRVVKFLRQRAENIAHVHPSTDLAQRSVQINNIPHCLGQGRFELLTNEFARFAGSSDRFLIHRTTATAVDLHGLQRLTPQFLGLGCIS